MYARADWPWGPPPWHPPLPVGVVREWRQHHLRRPGAKSDVEAQAAVPAPDSPDDDDEAAVFAPLSDAELEQVLADLIGRVRSRKFAPPILADMLLKCEKIQTERQRRQIAACEYVPAFQAERERVAKLKAVATMMQQLPRAVAPLVYGLEIPEIEALLSERIRSSLTAIIGDKLDGARNGEQRGGHDAVAQAGEPARSGDAVHGAAVAAETDGPRPD
jgi:hypothetical protein